MTISVKNIMTISVKNITLIVGIGWNSVQEICTKFYGSSVIFIKLKQERPYFPYWWK